MTLNNSDIYLEHLQIFFIFFVYVASHLNRLSKCKLVWLAGVDDQI